MRAFGQRVVSVDELHEIVGRPGERAVLKERPSLDAHSRAFIELSPFVLIGTADASGHCDVSPKGDAPGFVRVMDDRRLLIPDRPGNRRLDGMRNLIANPKIGLLFLVPGRTETLRVNGRACISRDGALLDLVQAQGKSPLLAIGVDVEQVFLHCGKATLRSRLWSADSWAPGDALPSLACMLHDQIQPDGVTREDYERDIEDGNRNKLY